LRNSTEYLGLDDIRNQSLKLMQQMTNILYLQQKISAAMT